MALQALKQIGEAVPRMVIIDILFTALSIWFGISLVLALMIPLGWLLVKDAGVDTRAEGDPVEHGLIDGFSFAWFQRRRILRHLLVSGVLVVPTLFYWS